MAVEVKAKVIPDIVRRFMLRMSDRNVVKDVSGDPLYFETKSAAKAYRGATSEDLTVTYGPDHRLW